MGRFVPTLLAATVLLLPSGAVAQKVRTDYDHSANFEKYKTYKLVKIKDNPDVKSARGPAYRQRHRSSAGKGRADQDRR